MQTLNNPFFSIVTPVYNREDCIGECIESVIAQDYKNKEHIIVDDGSNDNTKEIVNNYVQKYSHINFIFYKTNKGVNFARNRAIEKAKGDFIILLDSDDYFTDGALEEIVSSINKYPGYKHYLFLQHDNLKKVENLDFINNEIYELKYIDWLAEKVWGNFVHIIKREIMLKYKFPEYLRSNEGVNFLRYYRESNKQLLIKKVVQYRVKGRSDSLVIGDPLTNINLIENQYRANQKLIDWFLKDYMAYNIDNVFSIVKKNILLGIALDKYEENEKFINILKKNSQAYRILNYINSPRLKWFIYILIKTKAMLSIYKTNLKLLLKLN